MSGDDDCKKADIVTRLDRAVFGHNGTPGLTTTSAVMSASLTEQAKDIDALQADRKRLMWTLVGVLVSVVLTLGLEIISLIKERSSPPNQTVTQSVGSADVRPESQRAMLTPDDVAEREDRNADTIRRWISSGKIDPQPVKSGSGTWMIDPNYVVHESGTKHARNVGE